MNVDRNLLAPQLTKAADQFCIALIEARQKNSYDPAHGVLNLTNVALLTDAWGIVYNLSGHQRRIIRVGGFLHDIERSPTEDKEKALKDEEFSAKIASNCLLNFNRTGVLISSVRQRSALRFAVANHGTSPWVEDPNRAQRPEDLKEIFREVLYLSDKMEQLDLYPAALRRITFVSGKRLQSTEDDLQRFGLDPNSETDRLKAFLQESVVRVTFVNPEQSFPGFVQNVITDLYKPQKDFIQATSKTLGIDTVELLAEMMLNMQDSQGKTVLDKRGIKVNSAAELAIQIHNKGGLTSKGIQTTSADLANSASETILYFSNHWREEDLERVVQEWQPKAKFSQYLKQGFYNYANGKWATDMQQRILLAA